MGKEEPATASAPGQRPGPFKDLLLAFSLANLCFIQTWGELLFDADGGYFNHLRVEPHTLLALLANLAWSTAVAWTLGRAVRRSRSRWLRRLAVMGVIVLLVLSANYVRVLVLGWSLGGLLRFGGLPGFGALAAGGLGLILVCHERVARLLSALLGILSPLAFLTVGRVLLLLLGVTAVKQPPPGDAPLAAPRAGAPRPTRVVWVIFDEMDQGLAFSARPAGLDLPEFDRLRAEALALTNAYPPGHCTLISMPALTTGKSVRTARAVGPSSLRLTLEEGGETVEWSRLTNVFDRALALGFNTAVVGWYHPYDRVMGRSLTWAACYPYMWFEMARGEDFLTCLGHQITAISFMEHRRRLAADYTRAMTNALSVATNSAMGLSLIHLPVPHPPGIYDAARGRLSTTRFARRSAYLDNLRLADRSLGVLRESMTAAGAWTNTWLVVSSDHWWRQSGSPDRRVPFLLKPPSPAAGRIYAGMINTVITGDLMLAILRGEVTDLDTAAQWLDRHQVETPPNYQDATSAR